MLVSGMLKEKLNSPPFSQIVCLRHRPINGLLCEGSLIMAATVADGIIIGGAGGAIAGLTVYLVQYVHNKWTACVDSKAVYKWLVENSQ